MTLDVANQIRLSLESSGLRCGVVDISRLAVVRRNIDVAYRSGEMGQDYEDPGIEELLTTDTPDWAQSIWVVAVPCPLIELTFSRRDEEQRIFLAEMYRYSIPMRTAEQAIQSIHGQLERKCQWAWLPLRALASEAGMGEFGRNNMLYLKGMGSYPWLAGFFSDVSIPTTEARSPRIMDRCRQCGRCVDACPSGALSREKHIMRADRCLNYATDFPERCRDWLKPEWRKELLGCLSCQKECPANHGMATYKPGQYFSTEETEELMRADTVADLSPGTIRKLGEDLSPYIRVIKDRLVHAFGA